MEPTISKKDFDRVSKFAYESAGIVLSETKGAMVQSRLFKRARREGFTSISTYIEFALTDPAERKELLNCLTTNKTDFFREIHHFQFLEEQVFPKMIADAKRGVGPRKLRIWHAGCSTGEEPYTMAMTLAESLLREGKWDVRLLASDIDTNVLKHAQEGVYDEERTTLIPGELKQRYMLKGKHGEDTVFKFRPDLIDLITFKQINLLESVWPINRSVKFDVIFCRNVIIYFDRPTQERLFNHFVQFLKPGGHLILGHSESLHGLNTDFKTLGHTIYRIGEPEVREVGAA